MPRPRTLATRPWIDAAAYEVPRLFQRFYRGKAARSADVSGLGLAIARALVEAQGGRISVDAAPMKGATLAASTCPE